MSALRRGLDRFIHHTATELAVGVLIVASVVLTVLEATTLPGDPWNSVYASAGFAITIIFILELSIRWFVARSTGAFFRAYWLDVLAVLPAVRALRMLRVLRLLRLVRLGIIFSRRTHKLAAILHEGLAENLLIFMILFVVFLIGAVGITVVESNNADFDTFGEAAWWSLLTLMAGEPIGGEARTFSGKVLEVVLMLGGFTIFAMFTGVVSAVMVARLRGRMEAKEMELDELTGHTLIGGWNRAGSLVVRELQADPQTRDRGVVIVAECEEEPELPEGVNPGLVFFLRGDATSTEVLRKAGVERATTAVLLADKSKPRSDQDRDARTILAALIIEKLNPGIYTTAELLHRDNATHLKMAGVEDVVVGDEYAGNLLAHSSRTMGLVALMDELLTSTRGNEFYKMPVPPELVGRDYLGALAALKQSHNALLIGLEWDGDGGHHHVLTNPPVDYRLQEGQSLIVIAHEAPGAQ